MEGFEPKRPVADTATTENLKHLARLIERGEPLSLKINGRSVALPADASFAIDLERDPRTGCVKVDIRWSLPAAEKSSTPSKGATAASSGAPAEMLLASAKRRDPAGPSHGTDRVSHIRLKALITAPTI